MEDFWDPEDACERIMAWAAKKPWFDTSFVESLQEQLNEGRQLSYDQEMALDRILKRFHIR